MDPTTTYVMIGILVCLYSIVDAVIGYYRVSIYERDFSHLLVLMFLSLLYGVIWPTVLLMCILAKCVGYRS